MRVFSLTVALCLLIFRLDGADSICNNHANIHTPSRVQPTRRIVLGQFFSAGVGGLAIFQPKSASAAADCVSDCLKNCKKIAPKDLDYCQATCSDYCAQDNRTDGLSGSVSASGGEVGILGGTFGQGTVPKGDDRPPSFKLPGLDFTSTSGKQLIGY